MKRLTPCLQLNMHTSQVKKYLGVRCSILQQCQKKFSRFLRPTSYTILTFGLSFSFRLSWGCQNLCRILFLKLFCLYGIACLCWRTLFRYEIVFSRCVISRNWNSSMRAPQHLRGLGHAGHSGIAKILFMNRSPLILIWVCWSRHDWKHGSWYKCK